jgi:hypothetical protein
MKGNAATRLEKLRKVGWKQLCQDEGNQLLVLKKGKKYEVHFKSQKFDHFSVAATPNPGFSVDVKICPDPPCDL